MNNCYEVFGEHAFRKWPWGRDVEEPDQPCIVRELGDRTGRPRRDQESRVQPRTLARVARDMMTNDDDFIRSISSGTGSVRNVQTRLSKVREAAAEVLG